MENVKFLSSERRQFNSRVKIKPSEFVVAEGKKKTYLFVFLKIFI